MFGILGAWRGWGMKFHTSAPTERRRGLSLFAALQSILLLPQTNATETCVAGDAFQQAKADHDFEAQELELKTNTDLTRQIHVLTEELHRRLLGGSA
jgi:hypothetical protein